MFNYDLSEKANNDLENISDYTKVQFGNEQAITYSEKLRSIFRMLCQFPEMGKTRNELQRGLLSFPCESHVIFYQVLLGQIKIVRILHSRQLFRP